MDDDEWGDEVMEERHHWYVHDRMDSFVTGAMTGMLLAVGFYIASSVLPWFICLPLSWVAGWLVATRHEAMIVRDNRGLWHFEEDDDDL